MEILTLAEAAQFLKISPNTLRAWIRSGKIPAMREGRAYRIKKQDIERLFRRQK